MGSFANTSTHFILEQSANENFCYRREPLNGSDSIGPLAIRVGGPIVNVMNIVNVTYTNLNMKPAG